MFRGYLRFIALILQVPQIHPFHFFSCPWCLPEEFQAGADTWIVREAFDRDPAPHFLPAEFIDECFKHHVKRDAMKRIVGLIH